jgi:hypothetical protein
MVRGSGMSVIEAFKLAFLMLTYSYPTLGGTNRVINHCLTILVFKFIYTKVSSNTGFNPILPIMPLESNIRAVNGQAALVQVWTRDVSTLQPSLL